jgi:hypothetical protein
MNKPSQKITGLWDVMLCSLMGFSNISEEHTAPIFMANSYSFTKLYGITSRSGAMKVI